MTLLFWWRGGFRVSGLGFRVFKDTGRDDKRACAPKAQLLGFGVLCRLLVELSGNIGVGIISKNFPSWPL